jgi:hypothetical protein
LHALCSRAFGIPCRDLHAPPGRARTEPRPAPPAQLPLLRQAPRRDGYGQTRPVPPRHGGPTRRDSSGSRPRHPLRLVGYWGAGQGLFVLSRQLAHQVDLVRSTGSYRGPCPPDRQFAPWLHRRGSRQAPPPFARPLCQRSSPTGRDSARPPVLPGQRVDTGSTSRAPLRLPMTGGLRSSPRAAWSCWSSGLGETLPGHAEGDSVGVTRGRRAALFP